MHFRHLRSSAVILAAGLTALTALAPACGEDSPAWTPAASSCARSQPAQASGSITVQWSGVWDEVAAPAFLQRFHEANPAIAVSVAPAATAGDTISRLTGSSPPTIAFVPLDAVGALAELGAVRPLDNCLSDGAERSLEAVQKLGIVQGTRYGVATNVTSVVLLYDAAAFRKAGLDPDKPPSTWPQLQAAATALREQAGIRSPIAGLSPLLSALEHDASGELPADALTWLKLSNDDFLLSAADVSTYPPLGDGRAALHFVDPGELWGYASSLAQGQAPAADLRVAPVPGTHGPIAPIAGGVWVISSAATPAQVATATALLDWLLGAPQQATLHQLTDLFPASADAASHEITTGYWHDLPLLSQAWNVIAAGAAPPPVWMLRPGATIAVHQFLADATTEREAIEGWGQLRQALARPIDPKTLLACTLPPDQAPMPLTSCVP